MIATPPIFGAIAPYNVVGNVIQPTQSPGWDSTAASAKQPDMGGGGSRTG